MSTETMNGAQLLLRALQDQGVDTVFGYPGVGQLVVSAISARDTPLVQACVLITASGFILVNLLVDVSYVLIDPRIRLS